MLELVIFDADGVLFDSTESNTAYYNAIFKLIGEPPLDLAEERAGVFMSALQIFEQRAKGDLATVERMREVARTMDSTPFFKLLRPYPALRGLLSRIRPRIVSGSRRIGRRRFPRLSSTSASPTS